MIRKLGGPRFVERASVRIVDIRPEPRHSLPKARNSTKKTLRNLEKSRVYTAASVVIKSEMQGYTSTRTEEVRLDGGQYLRNTYSRGQREQ